MNEQKYEECPICKRNGVQVVRRYKNDYGPRVEKRCGYESCFYHVHEQVGLVEENPQ
mgnify:CR=1 FL=1